MDPITVFVAKQGISWWMRNKPFSPYKRERRKIKRQAKKIRRKNRRRVKHGLPLLEEPKMPEQKQTIQGGLTYSALGVTGLAYVLDLLGMVPVGYDAATTAGVLLGLVAAGYGRLRREKRA